MNKQVTIKINHRLYSRLYDMGAVNKAATLRKFQKKVIEQINKMTHNTFHTHGIEILFKEVSEEDDPTWDINEDYVNCNPHDIINTDIGEIDEMDISELTEEQEEAIMHVCYRIGLRDLIRNAQIEVHKNQEGWVVPSYKLTKARKKAEIDKDGYLILYARYARKKGTQLKTEICPFCGRNHLHVGEGHRGRHCGRLGFAKHKSTREFKERNGIKGGYIVKLRGEQ